MTLHAQPEYRDGFTGMPSSCVHCPATKGQGWKLHEPLGNERNHQHLEVPESMRHFQLDGSGKTKGMWGSLQSLPHPYHGESGESAIRNRTHRCCQGFQCFGTAHWCPVKHGKTLPLDFPCSGRRREQWGHHSASPKWDQPSGFSCSL